MAAVNVVDGVKYGFVLLGYFIAVFVVGGVLFGIGLAVSAGGTEGNSIGFVLVGGLLALIGGLVINAGLFGVLYKIVADGVKRGIETASEPAMSAEPSEPGEPTTRDDRR
ncbi:hypothetical protein BRC86_09585 [Halobacteriales archaeon QS_3_64_16]|nr:MAG: hypothetical protein BRC86_09585 [Halobacteriales archaeon QS_3_64_16]